MSGKLKTSFIAVFLLCALVLLLKTNVESTPSLRAKRLQFSPIDTSSLANPVGWFTIKQVGQDRRGFYLNNSLPLNGQVVLYGNISYPLKSNFLFKLEPLETKKGSFDAPKYRIRVQSQASDNDPDNTLYALKTQNGRLVVGIVNENPGDFEWNLIKDQNGKGFYLYNVKARRCIHLNDDNSIIIRACSTKATSQTNQNFY